MAHGTPEDGIPSAAHLKASVCEHGTVTFDLIDAHGQCFARASMSPIVWVNIVDAVCTGYEHFSGPRPSDARQ